MVQENAHNQKLKVDAVKISNDVSIDANNLDWWRTWTSSWWANVYF